MRKVRNYINGEWVESVSSDIVDVLNPATGEILAKLPLSTKKETEQAIESAQRAFEEWNSTPPLERSKLLMNLAHLMEENIEELSTIITKEHGKTLRESQGEIKRAIENIEVACSVTSLMGDVVQNVATGIDEYALRHPLGVCASINPFNFPVMVPFWSLPYALATGNTVIVKPSPLVPLSMEKVFELIHKAGFPRGVVNLVNGGEEVGESLLESPLVKAITFVGSTKVGKYVYERCANTNKRAQVQTSAKNFGIIMPDAQLDQVIPNVVASAFDCAGQRCLALANILVIDCVYKKVKQRLVECTKNLKVGYGLEEGVDMGPVISEEAKRRIEGWIEKGIKEGAKIALDGRGIEVKGYPNGYWIGPTILEECSPEMEVIKEEIFGPVLCLIPIGTLEEAIEIINSNRYANAAVIYTQNGAWARQFKCRVRHRNLGVNIGVAAPIALFPFAGSKDSFFGVLHAQGKNAFEFFTDLTIVIERWY